MKSLKLPGVSSRKGDIGSAILGMVLAFLPCDDGINCGHYALKSFPGDFVPEYLSEIRLRNIKLLGKFPLFNLIREKSCSNLFVGHIFLHLLKILKNVLVRLITLWHNESGNVIAYFVQIIYRKGENIEMGVPLIFKDNKVQALRKEKHLTQEELGKRLGTSVRMISNYESGYITKIEKACEMSEIFGCSLDYLLGLSDYRNIGNNEISKITGLSDNAIENLRKTNECSQMPDNEITRSNKLQLDTINRMISSMAFWEEPFDQECICHSVFENIGKYLGLTTATIDGDNKVMIDNEAIPELMSVNELYRSVLLKRIEKQLDSMRKENK